MPEYDFLFKIMTLGNSSVGKTAIQERYVEEQFGNNYFCGLGIDFKIKTIGVDPSKLSQDYRDQFGEDKPVRCKLQIWDTAGQERYR